jgi:hypothetical protein
MVYHDHDGIKAPGFREVSDKIDGDLREGAKRRGGNRGQRSGGGVSVGLHLLTKGATLNVMTDKSTHAGPPVISLDKFFGLKMSWMAGGRVIMVQGKDARAEMRGNIGSILVEERSIVEAPVRQGGFHGRGVKTIKGLLRSKDDGIRERVGRLQRS